MKGRKKDLPRKYQPKEIRVTILLSDKTALWQSITRNKEVVMKVSTDKGCN